MEGHATIVEADLLEYDRDINSSWMKSSPGNDARAHYSWVVEVDIDSSAAQILLDPSVTSSISCELLDASGELVAASTEAYFEDDGIDDRQSSNPTDADGG